MTTAKAIPPDDGLYLAIDQGGHASRAFALDATGTELASAFVPIETLRPRPGHVEHAAEALVVSVQQAIETLAGKLGDAAGRLVAAGLATQRSSIACWNRHNGNALAPVLSWQDLRAADTLVPLRDNEDTVRRITGLRLSGHYGASKLRWCLDHLVPVGAAGKKGALAAGPLAAFLLHRLLDERPLKCDPVNASRTLLCERSTSQWSPAMLQLFDVPKTILPRIVPNAHAFGTLAVGKYRVPLTVCTGDQTAALFAHGLPKHRCAYLNAGTGAFVQVPGIADDAGTQRLLASRVWQDRDGTLEVLEGTINGAGSALRLVSGDLGLPLDSVHRDLDAWLRRETAPPLFINGVSGLAAPYWRPDIQSEFVGEGSPAAKIVAVVESIAFLVRDILALLADKSAAPNRILLTGGMAQVDAFCQRIATVTGLEVRRPLAAEATIRGLGFLLAGRPDTWPVAVPGIFPPTHDTVLEARYLRWRDTLGERLASNAGALGPV